MATIKSQSSSTDRFDEYDEKVCGKVVQWAGKDNFFQASRNTVGRMPSGVYTPGFDAGGNPFFKTLPVVVDELITFPGSLSENILKDIETFWNATNDFKEVGVLQRRGYIFWGPPGSGKTCMIQQIIRSVVASGGIVLMCNEPRGLNKVLEQFRDVEPTRPLVCIFEDLDTIVGNHGESSILSILDGEQQIDRVLNIATTNYPERLSPRLIARPRRFDEVIFIDYPNASMRATYFEKKLKIEKSELAKWVKLTAGFTFASCAELVVSVKCLGKDMKKSAALLRLMADQKLNSTDYLKKASNL